MVKSAAQISAAQRWINNMKPPKIDTTNLGKVEFKSWKPDDATLRAWARASDPYKREAGDGR